MDGHYKGPKLSRLGFGVLYGARQEGIVVVVVAWDGGRVSVGVSWCPLSPLTTSHPLLWEGYAMNVWTAEWMTPNSSPRLAPWTSDHCHMTRVVPIFSYEQGPREQSTARQTDARGVEVPPTLTLCQQ
jgi:hypothetical protein